MSTQDEPNFKPARKFYDTDGNEIVGDPSKDEVDDEESKQWACTKRDQRAADAKDAGR